MSVILLMNKKTKTTAITAILLLTVFASSMGTANALPGTGIVGGFDFSNMSGEELENMPAGLSAGLGQVFGMFDQLGPSGAALGQLFGLLLGDIVNLSVQDTLIPHVYVLNASHSEIYERTVVIDSEPEIHYLWNDLILGAPTTESFPYLEIEREGHFNVTYESGASIVMVIWDNDDSFITALQKIIDAVHKTMKLFEEMGDGRDWTDAEQQRAITQIISYVLDAITYLLIHINDIINGDELITANVGDSRAYIIRDEAIEQITEDHSLMAEMINDGVITAEQAATHPYRNVILRSIGAYETVQVDIFFRQVAPEDILVVCSDGLTHLVSNRELVDIVNARPPADATRQLVALANERGGDDNISVSITYISHDEIQGDIPGAGQLPKMPRWEDLQHP